MALNLPLIDIEESDLVDWLENGERASMTVLNRPSKDLAAVLNNLIALINDGSVGGSGQMLGSNDTEVKAISYNAQTISENIIITSNLNAYSVGDITIEDGYDVVLEDNAIWKIL